MRAGAGDVEVDPVRRAAVRAAVGGEDRLAQRDVPVCAPVHEQRVDRRRVAVREIAGRGHHDEVVGDRVDAHQETAQRGVFTPSDTLSVTVTGPP